MATMLDRLRQALSLGAVAALAAGWPAAAQQAQRPAARPAAPSPAPQPAEAPERTTASFGDWSVVCVAQPAPAGKMCEMSMTIQDQRQQPVAILALGRSARSEPLKLVARVPVNVQVATPARLTLEGEAGAELAFRSCSRLGCFAELELRDEALLRRLRARGAEQPGRVEWRDAAGNEAAVPFSFRGFSAAFEALGREAG